MFGMCPMRCDGKAPLTTMRSDGLGPFLTQSVIISRQGNQEAIVL